MLSFAHSTSLTTLIQVLIPSRSVYQQTNSPHRHTQRHIYRAEHIFSLPAVWVSISLCHSVLSRVWHNAWQQFGAVDLEQYMKQYTDTSRSSTHTTTHTVLDMEIRSWLRQCCGRWLGLPLSVSEFLMKLDYDYILILQPADTPCLFIQLIALHNGILLSRWKHIELSLPLSAKP